MAADLSTRLLHTDLDVPEADALGLPVVRSVTYRFNTAHELEEYLEGGTDLYLYSRYENPTVRAAEATVALTENAPDCALFASGMAAATTVLMAHLRQGERIIASSGIYGGVFRFLRDTLAGFGVEVEFVEPEALYNAQTYRGRPQLVWIESPVNPTLRLIDIERVAELAHRAGALLAVDATFASPVNQQTFTLGADFVLHSATKFLNGHSDVLAGAVVGRKETLERVRQMRRSLGGNLSPSDAYELVRGMKTLELRVQRQNATALELAKRLSADKRVAKTLYPGLETHPDHALAKKQMKGFGGVVTFSLSGGYTAATKVFDRLKLFERAASLGGVESLASLPVLSSHHGYSDADLELAGVDRGMVRLSVGLENVEELWADLDQAL